LQLPTLFQGPDKSLKTALFLLSIAGASVPIYLAKVGASGKDSPLKIARRFVIVSIFALIGSTAAYPQKAFSVVSIPGVSPNSQIGINNSGQVLVNMPTSSAYQPSTWSRLSGSQEIALVGTNDSGVALNGSGEIVGAGVPDSSGNLVAFVWGAAGTRWLESLGGHLSVAEAINNAGAVAGLSYTATTRQHAFLWSPTAGIQDLTPDLTSTGGATATGINSSNQVVGYYFPNGSGRPLGFSWTQAGGLQNVGPTGTLAYAVNDSGTVIGKSPNAAGYVQAFSWTQAGGMKDLGTLGGGASSALSINNLGWIVGTSLTPSTTGLPYGFLWTPSGGMQGFATLSSLGASQHPYSMQVNDFGVIAVSTNIGGYLLVPTMMTTFTSSQNPSTLGQPVTFTATMNSIAGPPPDGERVQFVVSGVVVGSAPLNGGVARFTTSSISVGAHSVVAKYNGDANYLPAKYTAVVQQVN
jgi:probable HAF family extracellular repeat protein